MVEQLYRQFDEEKIATGIIGENWIMETFVNKKTGTWTVLTTNLNGMTCVRASGEGWKDIKIGESS